MVGRRKAIWDSNAGAFIIIIPHSFRCTKLCQQSALATSLADKSTVQLKSAAEAQRSQNARPDPKHKNQTEVVEQADKEISLGFKNRQGLSFPRASKNKTQLKKTANLLLQRLLLLPPRKNSLGSPSLTLWKKIRVWGFNQRA
jgi:hypothetical protein